MPELFAFNILMDKQKVDFVLDKVIFHDDYCIYSANTMKEDGSFEHVHITPLLLLFTCILVKRDEIDFQFPVHLGLIYYKAIRLLYKRNRLRVGRDGDKRDESFAQWLKALGKEALHGLQDGPHLVKRNQLASVCSDIFDCGILGGHQQTDPAADILVTFPHITVQEFLASFYYKKLIKQQKELYNIVKRTRSTPKTLFESDILLAESLTFQIFFDCAT